MRWLVYIVDSNEFGRGTCMSSLIEIMSFPEMFSSKQETSENAFANWK